MPGPPALHDLERDVMEVLWAREEATVREVMRALNAPGGKERAYTTYMTTLRRLDRKGLATRRRVGKTDHYRPVMTREAYADLRAAAGVDALVDEFGAAALSHFARRLGRRDPDREAALERLARER